ncbi:TlpA family protein disulfide reductase [Labilibacter marinus]|uniref:TlpA family protein disulfide reductase n=1 Tax=Labilibacter marinus TaxID=1477105 RepID=UPI0009FA2FED|nr:TlpA disulfide reductase family protein [Labilibacter marinus]
MKNLILTALVVLMSASMLAQKNKTIVNPYYEFKKSGIYNVSKIELSKEETRVHLQSRFLPNWWVVINDEMKLIDEENKETYTIKSVEGAEFGERLSMPVSGDSTVVLIFPPLIKKTKQFNFDEDIFGISLDEKKAGLRPYYSLLPEEINTWLNKEVDKCSNAALKDFKSDNFFTEDKGRIVGYIKGYSVKSKLTTGVIYLSNYLTREDYPMVVEVQPDGRFEVEIPLISPLYSNIQFDRKSIPFYLEPGQTLGMILNWEDFLNADRFRHKDYHFPDTGYKGKLAKVNNQLLRFEFEGKHFHKYYYMKKNMSLEEKVALYNQQKDMEMAKLKYYGKMWNINMEKTYTILRNEIILTHAEAMLDIEMRRSMEARKDKENKELQEPLPDSFYDFMGNVPLNDQSLIISDKFKVFINRFEYSNLVMKHRNEVAKKYPLELGFFEYLLKNEVLLSKEDRAYLELAEKKDKTPEEMEHLKDMQISFSVLKDRYSDSFSTWNTMAIAHYDKVSDKMWELAKIEMTEQYGAEDNLVLDIATLRTLKYKFKQINASNAQALWGELKQNIDNDYLVSTGDALYSRTYDGANANAYALPQGKAADIFNKIIAPHKGKVLVVDFWATSCGPCVSGIKRMKETRKQYASNPDVDFVFITNDRSTPLSKYDKFVKEQDLINTYRISNNDYLYLRQLFKFNGIPRYVVIDKDGKVLNDNFNMYQFEKEIAKLLVSDKEDLSQK